MNSEESGDERSGDPSPALREWFLVNWGYVAVAAAGIVLIAAAIFLLLTEDEPADADTLPAAEKGDTAAPVDINPIPTPPPPTPTITPVPESEISDQGIPMILVPTGSFRMGSTDEDITAAYSQCEVIMEASGATEQEDICPYQEFEAEGPAHEVGLDSYYIDLYEVTNEQYAGFLNEVENQMEGGALWLEADDEEVRLHRSAGTWTPLPGYGDHPVTEVTWYGAQAYCNWRGGRLPTEAEWEKAARWNPETGEVTRYPWGDQPPNDALANFAGGIRKTVSVGSFPVGASLLGVYDMAGNVFEWVQDWFSPDYYKLDAVLNPQGPVDGTEKVVRGGSWGDFSFILRAANRGHALPKAAFNFVGFRCVKDVWAVES